jgi:UDP:flavonoid glycosyltransferase YjiC (YdhE family)
VVVASGAEGVAEARRRDLPTWELVADFGLHALLLPRCSALVTQGGAGTIVAALCHGLPHLILPQGADQFRNAATAEDAGVAVVLPPPQLTPDEVAAAVRRLLDDPGPARAAQAVQTEIASMPDADAVLTDLTV